MRTLGTHGATLDQRVTQVSESIICLSNLKLTILMCILQSSSEI